MPILLFIGIGAMIDFGPPLANPKLFLCGAAAQAGIFLTILFAAGLGFDLKEPLYRYHRRLLMGPPLSWCPRY